MIGTYLCDDSRMPSSPTRRSTPAGRVPPDGPSVTALVDALMPVSRALVAFTARSLGQLDVDVTLSQYRMLVVLASQGPQRVVDLAGELGVQPSTVSRTVERLVRRGLVQRRQRAGTDRRVVWVLLAENGQALVGDVMRLRREAIAGLVSGADIPDAHAAAVALTTLAAAAGEPPDPQWWSRWEASTEFGPARNG